MKYTLWIGLALVLVVGVGVIGYTASQGALTADTQAVAEGKSCPLADKSCDKAAKASCPEKASCDGEKATASAEAAGCEKAKICDKEKSVKTASADAPACCGAH